MAAQPGQRISQWTPLMECMAPSPGIAMCHIGCCQLNPQRAPSMEEIAMVGFDLAKNVLQIHAVDADAAAICTAVVQPAMRVVPIKSERQQAALMSCLLYTSPSPRD